MSIQEKLIKWYEVNKRDLPFRDIKDPYKIWVSEIMLQQTTVTAVIPYYKRFIERFPDIETLANATIEEVYKYWEGLGYYRRALHLHKSANLMKDTFPKEYKDILALIGVGPGSLTVVSIFSLTKSLKTLIISMLLSFFIVKFVKLYVGICRNVWYNSCRR